MPDLEHEVELGGGYRISRDGQGEIRLRMEPWAAPIGRAALAELASLRLSECRGALAGMEEALSTLSPGGRADEVLDQYGALLRDRMLLEDFLATESFPEEGES